MDLSDDLPGTSPGMLALREKVSALLTRLHARPGRPPAVLILGETGTGKGHLARVLARRGPRAKSPFVDVSCATIPENLAEALLFGTRKGIYTTAERRDGYFQHAHGGIIFLDELGVLPEAVQTKLLKVVEQGEVWPLGASRSEKVDTWIIAATNEDVRVANPERRFRRDLYYRLNTVTLLLPPLRERGDDIILLAESFLAGAGVEDKFSFTLTPEARAALLAHDWPGNVRELVSAIEHAVAFADSPQITPELLALPLPHSSRSLASPRPDRPVRPVRADEEDERAAVIEALQATGWNVSAAAERLGWSRNKLRYRMERHGIRPGPTADPAPTPAEPSAPAPPMSPVKWERRRVTFLRVDVVRPSMGELAAFGRPSAAADNIFVEKIQNLGGRVQEISRTGVVAAFGLEQPIEDAPVHAAHAALAIQKAFDRARRGEGHESKTRSVLHVGQFLVGQVGGGVQIDVAAKREALTDLEALEAAAEPDTITVSGAAEPFLTRRFDLVPLQAVVGSSGMAYRLTGRGATHPRVARRTGPFMGSRQYVDLLRTLLASVSSGRGQFVGIVGEAGIGKSRLLLEFRRSLVGMRVTDLEGRCFSYGTAVPYLPLIEMLRKEFGINATHGPATIAERVRAGLEMLEMAPAEWMPFFLQLLGIRDEDDRLATLSPEAIKARTVEGIRQMLVRGSRRRPLLIVLEDLHWIDRTSEECVAALVEELSGSPILFVATYRPGYRPAWMARSYATQFAIQPLSSDDSLSVVRTVLQVDQVPEPLVRQILDKAEGNPFFLEELSRAVGEHGSPTLTIPDTIQEVLLTRIRRLPEPTKEILQTASVLGREVSRDLLATIWDQPGIALEPHLTDLMRLEFLYQQTESVEPAYVFKHALTQEVAYESLAAPRRQALHAAAGAALERRHAGHLEDAYEQLAYHFARTDQAERAAHYLVRFARKATALYAHQEAVRALREARAHVQKLPAADRARRRLEIVLWEATSLFPLGRIQEVLELLLPERDALEGLKDPTLAGDYHFMLGRAYSFLADHQRATEHGQRAIEEADRSGNDALRGKAYCLLAQDAPVSGRALEGIEDGQRAVALLRQTRELWWLSNAYWVVALNHAQIGEFHLGLEAIGQAHQIAEATGDPRQRTLVAWGAGILHAVIGDVDRGVEECRRALDLAPDPLNRAIAGGWLGFALIQKGDPDRAIPLLEDSVRQFAQWRYRVLEGWFGAFLAEAFREKGQLDSGLEFARRALQIATDAGIDVVSGWARSSLGRIAQVRGALTEAEDWFNQALESFNAMGSRYEMACTDLDLGLVHHARGHEQQAGFHLARARQVFTALAVPHHVRRTEETATRLGVVLPPVDARRAEP